MNKISIFEEKKAMIDLSTLIDTRLLICANSGGGKSYAVRKLLEVSYGDALSVILDMEGEFHTLREKYDFLLMGGTKGDVPLNVKSAKLLPKTILDLNVPTILDLSELKRSERIQFVKEFLETLMELPRSFHKACFVVLDEAHQFCGQQEKQDSTYAVIDLMTRGRKRGYSGVLCTQRISKLHKDAVAETNNVMIGRTVLDLDVERATDILGFRTKEQKFSLTQLQAGEFYAFGPAFSFRDVEKVKVGKAETTHPKVGMIASVKICPPTDKIKAMLTKLTDLPKEAEKELKDRNDMARRIRELEAQIRNAGRNQPNPTIDAAALNRAKDRGIEEGYRLAREEYSASISTRDRQIANLDRTLRNIGKAIETYMPVEISTPVKKPIAEATASAKARTDRPDTGYTPRIAVRQPSAVEKTTRPDGNVDAENTVLGRCERAILKFLAMREGKSFTKTQIGALTNYASTSGGFNNALSKLKTANLIQYNNGMASIQNVPDVMRILGNEYSSPEPDSLELWLNKLGLCARKIYELLKNNRAAEYTKEELGEQTGYAATSGGFNNAISELCTLGLAERSNGKIRFNPELEGI